MINNGKFDTNLSPFQWAKIAIDNGAGELLINNIDNDGSLSGFDIDIIKKLSKKFKSPMLALGGGGNWEHFLELFKKLIFQLVALKIYIILQILLYHH